MTPGMFCGPADHDWQRDPGRVEAVHSGRQDEGLICTRCGVTEAELDAVERGLRGTYDDDLPF